MGVGVVVANWLSDVVKSIRDPWHARVDGTLAYFDTQLGGAYGGQNTTAPPVGVIKLEV